MELFKNLYNEKFFKAHYLVFEKYIPGFDQKKFNKLIFTKDWEQKELKQRAKHIAAVLHEMMPFSYEKQVKIILETIESLSKNKAGNFSLEYLFFTEFIEMYGVEDYLTSIKAIERITQFFTCEFAVRPFIKKYPAKMMKQMLDWSKHKSEHVRRLASEGSRPRLPWGMALVDLKKDPSPVIPILENLYNDPSETVRRSVANNLNDIAKDHPLVVLKMAKKWKGKNTKTDRLIKHACRTLLKKAHPGALELFDLGKTKVEINDFSLVKSKIKIGDELHFSFRMTHKEKQPAKLRLEYGIYYVKSNGQQNRKIFQLSENTFDHKKEFSFKRKQSFKDFTTRKHYPGKHKIALVINGAEILEKEFIVVK